MTLEERIVDALHQTDDYEPSPDLFSRVGRSISEDLVHRRRRLRAVSSILVALIAIGFYLSAVIHFGATGTTITAWKLELLEIAVLTSLVIALGPVVRRFGGGFVEDVFHLSPQTAKRFLRLLDVAYYLVFAGLILVGSDFGHLYAELHLTAALQDSVTRIGVFAGAMGILHTATVASLPVIGLLFNSGTRRALRFQAGDAAPPTSEKAEGVDRLVRGIGLTLMVLAVGAGVFLAVNFIMSIVFQAFGD